MSKEKSFLESIKKELEINRANHTHLGATLMDLRPYQVDAISKVTKHLKEHHSALLIAPTGPGKTIMLSSIVKDHLPARVLVLQHRKEILDQNRDKFSHVSGIDAAGVFNAQKKETGHPVTLASEQTLKRHLMKLQAHIDLSLFLKDGIEYSLS